WRRRSNGTDITHMHAHGHQSNWRTIDRRPYRSSLHALRESPMIETIPLLKPRHPEFDGWLNQIRSMGTDSLTHFGNGYTHEGGYALQQNPEEFAALCLWLSELGYANLETAVYLEIGSASGGTGRYLWEKFRFRRFLSIDDGKHPRASEQENNFSRIGVCHFVGDSHSESVPNWLSALGYTVDIAFIDGDHSYDGIMQDLSMVLPHCRRPGAILILH